MSSNEDDYNDHENGSSSAQSLKKRRIQRACDICRRKKIRCDGVQMPGNRCSNCIAYSFDCSYIEAAKKRGPPKGYVESLETRLEKLEKLLRRLCPDDNLLRELDSTLDHPNPGASSNSVFSAGRTAAAVALAKGSQGMAALEDAVVHEEDNAHLILADNLKQLSLDPVDYRFFGKSSGAMLIQTAIELKNEYTGSDHDIRKTQDVLGTKREEFWSPHPWERNTSKHKNVNYTFPEPDLVTALIDIYFQHVNLYLPLLHRPTFEKLVADGCHYENDSFASTLLLVCAIGARFSDDPRVLLDGEPSSHSAGWKWFEQVQMVKKSLLAPPSLYDLQFYCLSVQFLQGSSAPQSCWTMVGIGIRLAQDVGAHRRKSRGGVITAEDELWKRAFWMLVCMDRMVSAALGRPCAIQDEDFDLEMPIECDDEYWDHPDPEQRWKQPPGKPSLITAFILYLKLNQVLAFSLRTIYSINKSKILLGFVGQQWEQHIVAELDSALNKWVDSVPDHLRWDPNREDFNFFNQSVVLYAAYYHIQILIHRPFIPSLSKPSPLSFPSLAICTNAARSCSHVVDMMLRHNPLPPPLVQMAVFTSGIVLLLSIWGGKRSGLSTDPNKEMADVHKCMRVLRSCEKRWHSAGRLWDILYELASVGDLPLPQPSPPTTQKREREGEEETPSTSPEVKQDLSLPDGPRQIAGSKRVTNVSQQRLLHGPVASAPVQVHDIDHPQPMQVQRASDVGAALNSQQQQYFTLPVYSDELGRLPLHGQIEFSSPQQGMNQQQQYWYGGSQPGPSGSNPIPTHSNVNVNVNINVSNSPAETISIPLTPGGRPVSSAHRRSVDGNMQGYEHHPGGMTGPGMSGSPPGFGIDSGAQHGMYNELISYPSGSSSRAMGPPRNPPPAHLHRAGPDGHYLGMGPPQQQHPHSGGPHPYQQGMQPPGPPPTMRYPGQQHPQGPRAGNPQNFVDNDTMAMWSNAPTGFELDEWGSYLMNVSELTQGSHVQPHGEEARDSNSATSTGSIAGGQGAQGGPPFQQRGHGQSNGDRL
ncbi:hypothetical protein D9611_002055 [Ephemerocybe angulata]|uniref:Zn(2)-C6 fungal-type domain-containing protein n=1 Tax=Ephemerocybe angulata TaxID=980116 RepID=A0A8H5CJX1_9AGAR|nr:hypothetical protein D9611_002055 [Tulosesus angulatus]